MPGGPTVCEGDNLTTCTQANVGTNCKPGDTCIVKHSGRNNIGCRLSKQEVILMVEELYDHEHIIGGLNQSPPRADIATIIKDVEDPSLSTRQHAEVAFDQFVADCPGATPQCWSPNHLNIYFVGNVVDANNIAPVAWNLDPRSAAPGERPFILFNDGGDIEPEGFLTGADIQAPTGYQPSLFYTSLHRLWYIGGSVMGSWMGSELRNESRMNCDGGSLGVG